VIGVDGSAHALNDDQIYTSYSIHQGCFGIPFFARPACMHVSASRLFAKNPGGKKTLLVVGVNGSPHALNDD